MTINYYDHAYTKLLDTKNVIFDAMFPKTLDYAYIAGGIRWYQGMSSVIYRQAGIIKVPLLQGVTDSTQGITFTVNYNQAFPAEE